jgi:hypothetical protein
MVIKDDLVSCRYPRICQVFDYCFHTEAIDPGAIWQSDMDVSKLPAFVGEVAPQLALDRAPNISTKGQYIDSHCWIVTSLYYVDIIEGLSTMGIMPPLIPSAFNSTEIEGFELFNSFTCAERTIARGILKREQLLNLSRIRNEIKRDVRLGRLLAGS